MTVYFFLNPTPVPGYESEVGRLYLTKFYGQKQRIADKAYLEFNTQSAILRTQHAHREQWDLARLLKSLPSQQDYICAGFVMSILNYVIEQNSPDYSGKYSEVSNRQLLLNFIGDFEFKVFLGKVMEAQYTQLTNYLDTQLQAWIAVLTEHDMLNALLAETSEEAIIQLVYEKTLWPADKEITNPDGGLRSNTDNVAVAEQPSPPGAVNALPAGHSASKRSEVFDAAGIFQVEEVSTRMYEIARDCFIYG